MKEIMAVIQQNKVNVTKKALSNAGITSFTATGRVSGRGLGLVDMKVLHGAEEGDTQAISMLGQGPRLIPKRLITVIVSDDWAERTIQAIIKANQTGNHGDGKIFVLPVYEATRVRTAETVSGPSGGNVLDSSGGIE
ncbi:MAG: P-II family nitrogen regulator [Deltaproteobacteria bacterium]|nr:P-II family nitrogen regulator [Deltaproteobacteria bacterium]MBN2671348.1 P-II family nitrogen regulator [Deltaproteobacteria bacterium]